GEDCYPSAYNGQVITTIGVVTAVKPDAAFPHFFIQQLDAPEFGGVYVYVTDGFEMLSLNDEVTLTAEVDEYYGLTELKNIENYSTAPCDCVVTPTPITTGLLGIECSMMAEGFEGMLVYLENVTVESVDEFGNWFINDGSGTAMVDDYIFDGEMPVPLAGDTFASITGTVDFNFGEYKIMPRNIDDIVAAEEECVADGDVTGDGNTDVLDIVAVVGHILGTNPLDWAVVCHADTDGSEIIDVLDIVAIIDMILNPTARNADATRANVRISTNGATLTADGFIGGVQMTLKHGPEFSLGLTENCYLAESNTENGETRLVILHPQGELFTTDGEYTIEEISVVSSSDYVETVIAEAFTLLWNYPNPFNPQTQINYSVAGNGPVQLAIFDLMGHEVAQLVNQVQNAGTSYSVIWNGTNEAGIDVPSGIYFARLSSAGKVTTSKLTLLR
ncbi:MAG: T9SS type A sorting domain-containing protein, partial [FCB group bacterium]|nr:T9SS type A sorting domain-containing protein [FCB group bacterium]